MSKLDKLKEEVSWIGRWLTVLVVTAFGLIGWLALNYKTADIVLLLSGLICVFVLGFIVLTMNRSAMSKIDEIGKLKK